MQADLMKLIAYGKVLDDDSKTLKDCNIKEGDFLVVMVSKVLFISDSYRLNHNQSPSQKTRSKKNQSLQQQLLLQVTLNRIPHPTHSLLNLQEVSSLLQLSKLLLTWAQKLNLLSVNCR